MRRPLCPISNTRRLIFTRRNMVEHELKNSPKVSPAEKLQKRCSSLARLLPSPAAPLEGRRDSAQVLVDNLVCFCRRSTEELNRPQYGRALHHRCVLILALQTANEIFIDDRAVRLDAGHGILLLPFQFHHYNALKPRRLLWTFLTFEVSDTHSLESLRYRPFEIDATIAWISADLLACYLAPHSSDLAIALLRVLLLRIQAAMPARGSVPISRRDNLEHRVLQLTRGPGTAPLAKQLAAKIGISESHLRARFRAACGESLGQRLRRLRLRNACGLLHLSDRRITEVGELCGFATVFSFSRAFRREYGLSPLAYRKSMRRTSKIDLQRSHSQQFGNRNSNQQIGRLF